MKKRIISVLLSCMMILSAVTPTVSAAEIDEQVSAASQDLENSSISSTNGFFRIEGNADGVEIVGYLGSDDYVEIPDRIDGRPVVSIGSNAFSEKKIKSVIIPDSIVSIGERAFNNCVNLENIFIPELVTDIGENAFKGCTALKNVFIPESVTDIGENAFENCSSDLTIEGCENSAAEEYANNNGISFVFVLQNQSAVLDENKSPADEISVPMGTTVTIKGGASGGSGGYRYKFEFQKASASNSGWTTKADFGAANSVTLTPSAIDKYTYRVTVKDTRGIERTKELIINSTQKPLENNSTLSPDAVTVGGKVTITGKASGGSGGYQYAFYYRKGNTTAWTTKSAFGKATSVTMNPATADTYTVRVDVKDSENNVVSKYLYFTSAEVPATSVSLDKTSVSLKKGTTQKLTAVISPNAATNKTLSWTSDNTSAATVSNGVIKAESAGTAKITVSTSNGKTDSCTVIVYDELKNTSTVSSTAVNVGGTVKITGSASGGIAPYQYRIRYKRGSSGWQTKVDYGKGDSATLTPAYADTYTVEVSVKDSLGNITAKTFTVTSSAVLPDSVTLDKTSITLKKGSTQKLTATISPSNATDKALKWTSSNTSVATVSSSGLVTAKNAGTANIMVSTSNGKTAYCAVLVYNELINASAVSATSVNIGTPVKITGSATGGVAPYEYQILYKRAASGWQTKLDYGQGNSATLTPAYVDTYSIKVNVRDNIGTVVSKEFTVVSNKILPSSVTLDKTSVTLKKGSTQKLTATVSPSNATDKTLSWMSSDTSVATVSNGMITAKSAGTAVIIVSTSNSKTAYCEVNVYDELINTSTVSATSVNVGTPVKITGSATGGAAPYEYQILYKRGASGWQTKLDYGKGDSATLTPAYVDTYKVKVNVRDNVGTVAAKEFTVTSNKILPSSVTLDKSSLTLEKGSTAQLKATINPSNATDKTLSWTSSNTSVATVSDSGLVKAVGAGTATVTVRTSNGKTAACAVKVIISPTEVTLDSTSLTIEKDSTKQITATINPSNATDKTLSWTSSNTSVATVSDSGLVKAVGAGTATVTVRTSNGKTAACAVKVIISPTEVTLDSTSLTIEKDSTKQITATINPSNATDKTLSWTSSNTSVATVSDSGLVKAVGAGTATVTVRTSNGKTAACNVTVIQSSVTINPAYAAIEKGSTKQLTAGITPSNSTDTVSSWTSSDTSVATVSSSGLVTAKSAGTATITVITSGGKRATSAIEVYDELENTSYASATSVNVGDDVQITGSATGGREPYEYQFYYKNPGESDWNLLASGTTTATLNTSMLGIYSVRIEVKDSSGTTDIKVISITVNEIKASSVSVSPTSADIELGSTKQLTATVSPSNAADKTLSWTSSDTSVATVSSSGLVTAKAKGTAVITAETSNGKTAACEVTVTSKLREKTALTASGDCGDSGDNVEWQLFDSGNLYIFGSGNMADWSYKNNPWYEDTRVNKVIIEPGVTSVGDYAFISCSELTKVTIPNSITSIGNFAFYYCTKLVEAEIPNSVTSIGDSSFSYCRSLVKAAIPNSVISLGNKVFSYCIELKEATISNNVVLIGSSLFRGCTKLEKVTIPDSVTSIGDYAFCYCTSLTELIISDNTALIGDNAFYNCTSLTEVTIPNSVTSIGSYAFRGCTSLIEVTIPNSVTSIGSYVFWDCTSLTEVTIPNSVTSIESYAFYNCKSLNEVTIPYSVTSIGYYAFTNCTNLNKIYFQGNKPTLNHTSGSNTDYYTFTNVTADVYYPNGDSTWNDIESNWDGGGTMTFHALRENTKLLASGDCGYEYGTNSYGDNLQWDLYESGNLYIFGNGNMHAIDSKGYGPYTSPWNDYKSDIIKVIIEYGVTSIGNSMFSGCTNLKEIVIPDSVTKIGDSALKACTSLTEVIIPNSVVSIYGLAFSGCTGLADIEIPDSVTLLEYCAFYGCTNIKSIYFAGDKPKMTKLSDWGYVFGNVTADVYYPNGNSTWDNIESNWNGGGTMTFHSSTASGSCGTNGDNVKWQFYDDGTLYVYGSGAIADYSASSAPWYNYRSIIQRIIIAPGVTSIGKFAFYNSNSLTKVTIPNTVTSIGYRAFDWCTKLEEVTIPESVVSIDGYAFWDCTKLSRIYFKGDKPEFTSPTSNKSFTSVTADVYYPYGNSTWNNISSNWDGGGTMTFHSYTP